MRGNVNLKADKYNADYWALQDRNEVRDTNILRYSAERARIAGELLSDPVLARLHRAALERVEARLAEFRRTEAYETLKESLLAASQVPLSQITAKPPKPRDPARIAALMSEVEKRAAARPKAERRTPSVAAPQGAGGAYLPGPVGLSAPGEVERVANHGVLLPADPRLFAPAALEDVRRGRFERRAARRRAALVTGGDRLLEIGAGIGFLPILSVLARPGLVALAQEERADLAEIARGIAAAHGLAPERFEIVGTPLLGPDDEPSGLGDLVAGFAPSVLVLNDPRLRAEDVAAALAPGLRRIVVLPGVAAAGDYPGVLAGHGFAATEAGPGGLVLDRGAPQARRPAAEKS
jgi:hypothetical protein